MFNVWNTYRISVHIFSVYPSLNTVWKFIRRTDTLCMLFCICAQQEKEENVRNFLKYWIIIFLMSCITLQLFISYMTYWQYYLSIWFFKWYNVFLAFWTSLKWETENSHTYAWLIWWWWFILLCKESVEMFWKDWSCIRIQNTGVKQTQCSYSFLLEL